MINKIYKGFSDSEYYAFSHDCTEKDRYDNLCKIVGRYAIINKEVNLGIVLPYCGDRGCVVATVDEDGKVIKVLGQEYF